MSQRRQASGSSEGGQFKVSPRADEQTTTQPLRLDTVDGEKTSLLEPVDLGCRWHGHEWDRWLHMYNDLYPEMDGKVAIKWLVCRRCKGAAPAEMENIRAKTYVEILGYVEKKWVSDSVGDEEYIYGWQDIEFDG